MVIVDYKPELRISALKTMYPSVLWTPGESGGQSSDETTTSFGYCLEGPVTVTKGDLQFPMVEGMFFSLAGPFKVSGGGKVVVIDRLGFRGLDQFGGPVEAQGRLCYIDNCKSSILVAPPRVGDPVFNLLTFPPGVTQTMHIHPSIRFGVISSGSGYCLGPSRDPIPLKKGAIFLLDESEAHCFKSEKEPMSVIAYHPDSDVGPTDSQHPMLSRTYTKF